jgi:hypothetical protein
MDDEQRDILRQAAALELQTCVGMRDRIVGEIATSLRWVQASLLLVNSGAAVAILGAAEVPPSAKVAAGAAFVVGIVFSLLTALIGARIGKDMPGKLSELGGYWLGVQIDLLRSEEIEREWLQYVRDLTDRTRWSYGLGFASLAAFIIGCVIIGMSIF